MSQLYRLFTVWNSDLFSIWFFGHLPFFWATLLKFRTTWLRFQATWFWARWLSSDLIDFLQSFPPNISRWWSHMIPQGHPQLSFQGSSRPPTRHMITPLYVMSMTCYLHMISEQFWKKVACGVDEWVNACCDILLRRERSRDNFLVDRLSGLPRITEYLLGMLCIPWYEIDFMLRLTWT